MAEIDAPDLQTRLAEALAGQYVIVRALGQGGMGTVFLARDVTLDREVAIKVISPDLAASPELRRRFILEARTVARLRHPNIVAVHTAGEANGLLYFVMEFVPGESLRDRMTREGSLDADDACGILHDLALALDYAHNAGIVHRDVKPENILLDGESGRPMLTDFGVAVALAAAGDTRLTGVGFVLGSPRYMSPEQASGDRDLDGRSDLYSLGLIGYEMLTGAPALDAASAASMLVKQLTEVPDPVIRKAPHTPAETGAAIDRVLLKNPADRFSRGAAFAAALSGATFDEKTPAHQIGRPGLARVAKADARKKRRNVLIAAAVAAVAFTGIGGTWFRNRESGNTRMYFVAPFEVQTADRSLDWLHEGSMNMLSLAFAQWSDLSVVDYERSLDLLRDAGLEDRQRIGLEDARTVARRAGAGTVITGQVTNPTSDSIQVVARLWSVASGKKLDEAIGTARAGQDPRIVFQQIASELLDLKGGAKVTLELTRATSSSVDAYRAYLEGVGSLNSWRLVQADSLLQRATDIDSTFALAYYKRALTLGWINARDRSPHILASQKAVDYKSRLPLRLQEIVVANNDLARAFLASGADGRKLFDAARVRLMSLVRSDSLDAEAWYGLADAQFHEATQTGLTDADTLTMLLDQSQRGFRRAIAIDSTNHLAYQHLVGIYQMASQNGSYLLLDGDTLRNVSTPELVRSIGADRVAALRTAAKARSRQAAEGWLARDPDAQQAYKSLSDAWVALGNTDSAVAVLERSIRRPSTASALTPYRIALLRQMDDDPRSITVLREALRRYPADSLRMRPEAERMLTVLTGLSIAGANGAVGLLDSLVQTAAKTDSLMPGSTVSTQSAAAFYVTAMRMGMGLPTTEAEKRNMLRGIQGMDAAKVPIYAQIRAQSVGVPYVAYLATKDPAFAEAARRWAAPAGTPTGAAVLPELAALEALHQGDTARAAVLVREFPPLDSIRKLSIGLVGLRLVARAEAAAAVGDLRRAVGLYEALDPKRFGTIGMTEPGFATYARSFLLRARLYEQLEEPAKAVVAYEEFLKRWKDADAPLQPQVREAQGAVARLRDKTTTVPVGSRRGRG